MLLVRRRPASWPAFVSLAWAASLVAGCASPGSPRPPSLHLPEPVSDLSALRSGNEVQLRFSIPRRTTDGQSLAGTVLHGALCRQESPRDPCTPVSVPDAESTLPVPASAAQGDRRLWVDHLPPALCSGAVRPITYRITVSNSAGRSAGPSDPVYTAAGTAPPPVLHFAAQGTRKGVLLQWTPVADEGDVLLTRTQLDRAPEPARNPPGGAPGKGAQQTKLHPDRGRAKTAPPSAPGVAILQAGAQTGAAPSQSIDNTVAEGVRYAYQAVRQTTALVGGRTLALQSAPTDPVEIAWEDKYPPPAPQQLTALGYATAANGSGTSASGAEPTGYAVDLIWLPVDDPRVTGYLVRRQALTPAGEPEGTAQPLNTAPLKTPGFHDSTADRGKSYRYEVVAVDARGNVSAPAVAQVSRQDAQP